MTRRRGRRSNKLLGDLTEKKRYWKLKQEALYAGPYLGILRPWAQEHFAPPPLFVRIQLCVSKNNTKN